MCKALILTFVVVLAGMPAAPLACDLWCASSMADAHSHGSVAIGACLDETVTVAPFVAKARQDDPAPPLAFGSSVERRSAAVDTSRVAHRWLDLDTSLPSPSFRQVLRI